jgi:tubulin polyglutamylase TTLL9
MWADVRWIKYNLELSKLKSHQRVNHFKNHCELTGKDNLIINLKKKANELKQQGKFEEADRFLQCIPASFILPDEYDEFYETFNKNPGTYIMKPVRMQLKC